MARARRASDDVYNARRRYRRQAERYLKKAQLVSGAAKRRYERLAEQATEKAVSTYENESRIQGAVGKLAQRFNITKENQTQARRRTQNVRQSEQALSRLDTRENQARSILSGNFGSLFYAGLIDIWRGRSDRDTAIKEYFGVSSLMDVLEGIEKAIPSFYDLAGEESSRYSDVTAALNYYVAIHYYVATL